MHVLCVLNGLNGRPRWSPGTKSRALASCEDLTLQNQAGKVTPLSLEFATDLTHHGHKSSRRRLVTNSSDRTLRQFNLPTYLPPNADREYIEQELEPSHRFNDPISRTSWHGMSFSPDGEWLAGGESQ